jgi:hypothetical protein
MLLGWITDSMQRLTTACPDAAQHLPSSAWSFFAHYANASPSVSSSLQSTLSLQAASHSFEASLSKSKANRKHDGGAELAHLTAISAPRAWTWKTVTPSEPALTLTDTQYRIAMRLNLGLDPLEPNSMNALPAGCPSCKKHVDFAKDRWHFLSCPKLMGGEVTLRHNAVVNALYHAVLTVGGQAAREPSGLHFHDGRRPDLQCVFPGQHVLTDVIVSHPLAPGHIQRTKAGAGKVALTAQHRKRSKYEETAARHQAQLLPFSVETCGALAPDAVKLVQLISRAGREHLGLWPHEQTMRQVLGAVAAAVQKGNAMAVLAGHSKATVRASAHIMGRQ